MHSIKYKRNRKQYETNCKSLASDMKVTFTGAGISIEETKHHLKIFKKFKF